MTCNTGNFELFLTENRSQVENCKYEYYRVKITSILRKVFFGYSITEQETALLEKHTNCTEKEWRKRADDFNFNGRFDTTIECEFLDANNMPSAI
jgi:hypothetical protein